MTKAILICENIGHVQEIDLDITPSKNEIFINRYYFKNKRKNKRKNKLSNKP